LKSKDKKEAYLRRGELCSNPTLKQNQHLDDIFEFLFTPYFEYMVTFLKMQNSHYIRFYFGPQDPNSDNRCFFLSSFPLMTYLKTQNSSRKCSIKFGKEPKKMLSYLCHIEYDLRVSRETNGQLLLSATFCEYPPFLAGHVALCQF
jgi:hypothetical protein